MALQLLERKFPNDHLPLLRWLMFTGVCAFGFVLAWHYGLFHLMLASDKTYISATICVLYLAATAHCFARTVAISHETDSAQRVFSLVSNGARDLRVVGADVMAGDGKHNCINDGAGGERATAHLRKRDRRENAHGSDHD